MMSRVLLLPAAQESMHAAHPSCVVSVPGRRRSIGVGGLGGRCPLHGGGRRWGRRAGTVGRTR